MKAHTPQNSDPARRRSSITNHRTSMGSSLPMPRTQSRIGRPATSQPTYDIITGAEVSVRPPSRDSFRKSTRPSIGPARRDVSVGATELDHDKHRREMDELKAELSTLRYTIDNHKQEEELAKIRHESELRDARRRAEEDFKKMQAATAEKGKASRQYEALLKEMNELRDGATNEKAALERRVREMEESKRVLQEEVEDIKSERDEAFRGIERRSAELQTRNDTLEQGLEELRNVSEQREASLKDLQTRLAEKDTASGALEAEVLRLKAQAGDVDTLSVIRRELSEQVTHIKKIEAANRKQATELDHYRRLHESIEVAEEEKRSLQRKVDGIEALQNELGEAKIQRQRLEDERRAWSAYFQSDGDSQPEFDSPASLARALNEERLQRASLVERLGALEAELSGKDVLVQSIESEKSALQAQIASVKSTSSDSGDSKARARLERQKALAIKEAEYLRAQLKAMDDEDTTFNAEKIDETKTKRIQELEDMVDQYRQEVQTLQSELATKEPAKAVPETGTKRPREDAGENEHVGLLSRKNRKLQDELSTLQASSKILEKELSVAQERLEAASQQSKTRVLSLRSNPTSDFEAVKLETLNTLRKQNADLLAQLQKGTRSSSAKSVPASTLDAVQLEVREAQAELASQKKHTDRLMKVWGAKTMEFRELVISLLGWDVVFMKNGRTKVTSFFYPKKDDEENSIEFDGDKGTMKVSGGKQSAFAGKIAEQIKFWVHERGSVPCLLAALTLEFWEEANKDKTMRMDT